MTSFSKLVIGAFVVVTIGPGSAQASDSDLAAVKPRAAVLPVQDRVGDRIAADLVGEVIRWELSALAIQVEQRRTRDAMRKGRIRNVDDADPAELREVATELDADWIVSVTMHDASSATVPSVAISLRIYSGTSGDQWWSGFTALSGLDGRSVLGYGEINDLKQLVHRAAERLTADLEAYRLQDRDEGKAGRDPAQRLGAVAIVPFAGTTERNATANAEAVTDVARATLVAFGIPTVSPGCSNAQLRNQHLFRWGSIEAEARLGVGAVCGADTILTGSVERYESGGDIEPRPSVAFGMRLLDAKTGRILWSGSAERNGWDRQGVFRIGRIHARGALAEKMMRSLTKKLLKSQSRRDRRNEESG